MTKEGITIKIYVQPRASRNAVTGQYNDALKIAITSPPVQGEANLKCKEFLAKFFDVSKSAVEILHGHKSRQKLVFIAGDKAKLEEKLQNILVQTCKDNMSC